MTILAVCLNPGSCSLQGRILKSFHILKSRWRAIGYDTKRHSPNILTGKKFDTGTCDVNQNDSKESLRLNSVNIQMISDTLHQQLFNSDSQLVLKCDENQLAAIFQHFKGQDLLDKIMSRPAKPQESISFEIPPLQGANIEEHFHNIAAAQVEPYKISAENLAAKDLPPMPTSWSYSPGWTKYSPDGSNSPVDFPSCDGLVFDVEVLLMEGNFPTIATAASPDAWYSWCSDRLFKKDRHQTGRLSLQDTIPLETTINDCQPPSKLKPRLVVGHNVGFDRSFIKEQYFIKGTALCFLDTMSLHIAVSGLTSFQRVLHMSSKSGSRRKEVREMEESQLKYGDQINMDWIDVSSLNNLNDVYQLYNKGVAPLKKAKRDVFMNGTMEDVNDQFQDLMTYCASDVDATHKVFKQLWTDYKHRFSHPVTLSGMLEMGSAYLPINSNWDQYISQANDTYNDLQRELKFLLISQADEACQMLESKTYLEDPWLWNLDWDVKDYKSKQVKLVKKSLENCSESERILKMSEASVPKRAPHLPGFPKWYVDLCPKGHDEYGAGPVNISLQMRIAPKLLRLMWDGFPLHYNDDLGWGYLVPGREITDMEQADIEHCKDSGQVTYPLQAAFMVCKPALQKCIRGEESLDEEEQRMYYEQLERVGLTDDESKKMWASIPKPVRVKKKMHGGKMEQGPHWHSGIGPFDIEIPGCWFYKLPHKDGPANRVGNPLSKDFIHKMEDGTLSSALGDKVNNVAKLHKMCSYWKNNQDRIQGQMVIGFKEEELPDKVTSHPNYKVEDEYGCIIPRIVPAGTITRRAVERTWMTASNAYVDRVGSELKSMIQCPPGYCFVGADVDSQELWIAALLGDAHFAGQHGCTAFSWMTLQGSKSDMTDLHSKTAKIMDITRTQAKIFNYGRIYGAGRMFAERLLQQFNHKLTEKEISNKVSALYAKTKGKRMQVDYGTQDEDTAGRSPRPWQGGSESHMFNKLESVAMSNQPRTPVLKCMISKALQAKYVGNNFMTSRINWVIQSSAVDYLHLMLTCMKWLCSTYNIDARFCISIHDEVRYLVAEEDCYRAALALQITNLLTRSMFASSLQMYDLPQSVAFFSCVEVDSCLRKESGMNCRTPSNPRGMRKGYGISPGEALDMKEILNKTKASLKLPN